MSGGREGREGEGGGREGGGRQREGGKGRGGGGKWEPQTMKDSGVEWEIKPRQSGVNHTLFSPEASGFAGRLEKAGANAVERHVLNLEGPSCTSL